MRVHALALGEDNWKAEVEAASVPVLVDFWAGWCGPCRAIAPSVETLAEKVAGRAKVGKVDVDAEPELAARFGVSSIPTLVVLREGRVVAHHVGSISLPDLERFLEEQLEPAAAH